MAAGARQDMGQPEMALRMLEGKELHSRSHVPRVARVRYAYADALLAAGRATEAVEWFHRAAAVDAEQVTDAAERLADLEGTQVVDVGAGADEPTDDAAPGGDPAQG